MVGWWVGRVLGGGWWVVGWWRARVVRWFVGRVVGW